MTFFPRNLFDRMPPNWAGDSVGLPRNSGQRAHLSYCGRTVDVKTSRVGLCAGTVSRLTLILASVCDADAADVHVADHVTVRRHPLPNQEPGAGEVEATVSIVKRIRVVVTLLLVHMHDMLLVR